MARMTLAAFMAMGNDETCVHPHCIERGEFGYRDKETKKMAWHCAAHRLGQYFADARRGAPVYASQDYWEGWEPIE
jgi:hypothetical protein